MLNSEIILLRQIIGALVTRLGGYVDIPADYFDQIDGDMVGLDVDKSGARIRVHRTIKSVSSLN